MSVHIGIIGDVHLHFDEHDVEYFNASTYDLLLFVGDLVNYRSTQLLNMGKMLARLTKPVYVVPGNHDGTSLLQLLAEVTDQAWLRNISSLGNRRRLSLMKTGLDGLQLCGYSVHSFDIHDIQFDLVVGRPHAMGGGKLSFPRQLKTLYGISSMEESIARLKELVESSSSKRMIFLAHNGPTGLGESRDSIWGCDFRKTEGDFGDPDLRVAVDTALARGIDVSAVIAGHMHHHLKGGGLRHWHIQRDRTHYINAARVPRIEMKGHAQVHHHVSLTLTQTATHIEPVEVSF